MGDRKRKVKGPYDGKWAYSFHEGGMWSQPFDTKEQAIEDALRDAVPGHDTELFIGQTDTVWASDHFHLDNFLERAGEDIYDDHSIEWDDDVFDVGPTKAKEIEQKIRDVMDEVGLRAEFYIIREPAEEHEIIHNEAAGPELLKKER